MKVATISSTLRKLTICLPVFLSFSLPSAMAAEGKPNIVYILADDLGYGDLGSYGQTLIKTPALDRMADEGMRFTDHYAGSTVCAPSRCSLMTGLHQGNARVRGNRVTDIADEDLTIAEVMKKAGYRTAMFGKWGMGAVGSPGEPSNQGFDEYYGYLCQVHAHNHFPAWLIRDGRKEYLRNSCLFEYVSYGNHEVGSAATEKNEYSQSLFTREAMRFIEASKDEPFFLYLPYIIPHVNNEAHLVGHHGMEVPDQGIYADRDWPDAERSKAAMISYMDADVGRILQHIQELGLDENTLVIFTSDNGPHKEGIDPEFFSSNGPLKGIKRDLYEGGIRVPMIAWWPGKVEPGTTADLPSAFWDMMPTFAELGGVNLACDTTDGISIAPTLLGRPAEQQQHAYLYWEFTGTQPKHRIQAVRSGDWKLLHFLADDRLELYNLKEDVGESKNLASSQPDILDRLNSYLEEGHTYNANYPLPGE